MIRSAHKSRNGIKPYRYGPHRTVDAMVTADPNHYKHVATFIARQLKR